MGSDSLLPGWAYLESSDDYHRLAPLCFPDNSAIGGHGVQRGPCGDIATQVRRVGIEEILDCSVTSKETHQTKVMTKQ